MNQVRPSQIVQETASKINPSVSLPRDLSYNFISPTAEINQSLLEGSNNSTTPDVISVPETPAILGIKEQIVNFNPDGTATIDLILDVEDIDTAVEYDVRVTKNAGTI